MNRLIILLLLITTLSSCKTLKVEQETQYTTTVNTMLGSIGEQKKMLLDQDYNNTALPKYNQPIKLQANLVVFNSKSFKAYKKVQQSRSKKIVVNYVDSVKTNRPTFLKLDISDRVSVISSLNSKANKNVFEFIKNSDNAHIVTSVSIAINKKDLNVINNADELFLESTGINNYAIKVYKDNVLQNSIQFTEAVVFAYQTSNACWKENNKYRLQIIDLAEGNNKCPHKSYTSAKRAKKKVNYFNF